MTNPTLYRLPAESIPYLLPAGEGDRYLFGTQLATVIASAKSTGGLFELVVLSGGKDNSFPAHRHERTHEGIFVLDGKLEVTLDGRLFLLSPGDYVHIPAGMIHGYRMRSHHTRFVSYTTGGETAGLYATIGEPTDLFVHPPHAAGTPSPERFRQAESSADLALVSEVPAASPPQVVEGGQVPDGVVPYVLEAGEGVRLVTAEQLHTLLAIQKTTNGQFVLATCEGPRGNAIIQHFHERHTETFFCVQGQLTMWANGEHLHLLPGDFLHVPPNTIHSYRLDAHYTKFFSALTPGIFEPFFHTLGDPYDAHVFPNQPAELHLDRLIAAAQAGKLDLKVVGPPPDGSAGDFGGASQ